MASFGMMIWSALGRKIKQALKSAGLEVAIPGEHQGQEGGAIPVGSLQIGSMVLNRFKLARELAL